MEKETTREMIKHFLIEPAEKEYVILGLLLGCTNPIPLKRFIWKDPSGEDEKAHVWLIFPDFGWEIDAAYNNITGDDENNRIFFTSGQHPVENGRSRFANEKRAQGASDYQAVQIGTFGLEIFQTENRRRCLKPVIC